MTVLFGLAGLSSDDFQYALQADQRLLYETIQTYAAQANLARRRSAGIFVQPTPVSITGERYQLPITGYMQERGQGARGDSIRRSGKIDVQFPLKDFTDSLEMDDIDLAYTTPQELDAHVIGINSRADNTYRREILRRMFRNTNDTFIDEKYGTLTIRALANGSTDSQLYPPVVGSDTEATQDHYLTTGYAASAISDSNNPVKTAADKLILRYGRMTGGLPIATLINTAQREKIEGLTDFIKYVPNAIDPGNDTDRVQDNTNIPGEIIGYTNSSWVSVWDWIPANYMISVYLNAPAPLVERVDDPLTGLPQGLALAESDRMQFPYVLNAWRYRFGIGTRNRLNGVVTFIDSGSSYTIPSDYQ